MLTGFAVRKWNPESKIVELIVAGNKEEICDDWDSLTADAVKKLSSESSGECYFCFAYISCYSI